jgi:mono/diheme cytochrome c family protein
LVRGKTLFLRMISLTSQWRCLLYGGNMRMKRIVRGVVVLAILCSAFGQTMAQTSSSSLAQNPLAGSRVFGAKGCVKCHAVNGVGGTLGPDLGRSSLYRSLFDFAAAMWNHLPQMAERLRQLEMPRTHLDPWETGDLIAFLFTRQYFATSGDGDPQNGRQLFFTKQCVMCHQVGGVGGVLGPNLDFLQQSASPIFVATAMWNHGSTMIEAMRVGQITRPTFTAAELRDLIAYCMASSPTPAQGPLYVLPGRPEVGRQLFTEKQCVECHSVKGQGGRVGPDLGVREQPWSLFQFAAALWNKAPAMLEVIQARGMAVPQLRPEEMADLLAYLAAVGYFAESGDPRQGQELTTHRGCLGCHALSGQGGARASDLSKARGLDSPAAVIAALWNHLDVVEPGSAAQQPTWSQFSAPEMADLMAFLQGLEGSRQ